MIATVVLKSFLAGHFAPSVTSETISIFSSWAGHCPPSGPKADVQSGHREDSRAPTVSVTRCQSSRRTLRLARAFVVSSLRAGVSGDERSIYGARGCARLQRRRTWR